MVDNVETLPGVYKEKQRAIQRKKNGVKYNKFAWALLSRQIDCKPYQQIRDTQGYPLHFYTINICILFMYMYM